MSNGGDFCLDCNERLSDVCRACSKANGEDNWIVGRQVGAAVAFGLMGMAEAIRQRCSCPSESPSWAEACERCKGYP